MSVTSEKCAFLRIIRSPHPLQKKEIHHIVHKTGLVPSLSMFDLLWPALITEQLTPTLFSEEELVERLET